MGAVIGVDAGSVAIKVIMLLDDGRPVEWLKALTGSDVERESEKLVNTLLKRTEVDRVRKVCSTGYGRNLVSNADSVVSEILANALGAGWMWHNWSDLSDPGLGFGKPPAPEEVSEPFRTIVDIGGQDSKVITFTGDGLVDQFAMNDRCAAGTGRFLELMADVLEVDLERLDELALEGDYGIKLNSTCTVFAESEVVSLIAEGTDRKDVAAGVFNVVASRAVELARKIGWNGPVLFDGGTSHFMALREALASKMNCEVGVPPYAEFTTAFGAALYALESE